MGRTSWRNARAATDADYSRGDAPPIEAAPGEVIRLSPSDALPAPVGRGGANHLGGDDRVSGGTRLCAEGFARPWNGAQKNSRGISRGWRAIYRRKYSTLQSGSSRRAPPMGSDICPRNPISRRSGVRYRQTAMACSQPIERRYPGNHCCWTVHRACMVYSTNGSGSQSTLQTGWQTGARVSERRAGVTRHQGARAGYTRPTTRRAFLCRRAREFGRAGRRAAGSRSARRG